MELISTSTTSSSLMRPSSKSFLNNSGRCWKTQECSQVFGVTTRRLTIRSSTIYMSSSTWIRTESRLRQQRKMLKDSQSSSRLLLSSQSLCIPLATGWKENTISWLTSHSLCPLQPLLCSHRLKPKSLSMLS